MKKFFNKAVLNGTTVMGDGLTYPRIPNVYTGDNEGGYQRGDMMDANAVVEMIKELTDTGKITIEELKNLINEEIQERVEGDQDQQRYTDEKIKDLIGTSPETLDTLKEIADALGEDPDFAVNVWEKLAEVDQTLEDHKRASNLPKYIVGEGMDPGTSPIIFEQSFDGINLTTYRTDLDTGDIVSTKLFNAIPPATRDFAGLMYAADRQIIDDLPHIISDIEVVQNNAASIRIRYWKNEKYGGHWDENINITPATSQVAGAMSAADKQKLDSLVKYKAGNGIDITGDTISCTLDTSLYSIVTELPETGLPNKIYLLPSTKTEEGNIYTEYGYVDNKWEELGKYKADVDLKPYSKALYLPKYVLGHSLEGWFMPTLHESDKVRIEFKKADLINNMVYDDDITIKQADAHNAGVMSGDDKVKLDSIEAGAQVNTIGGITFKNTPVELIDKTIKLTTLISGTNETNFSLSYMTSETDNIGQPIYKKLYGLSTNRKYIEFEDSNEDSSKLIDLSDTAKQAVDNAIQSISVNGTPLEITNKGVNIPIHEYTAGDGINVENGVISTTPISIKTEKFSFVNSGSHQPTYNYSGVTIYDNRYISGTKYGIAFDEADIQPRTTITSPDGVITVCFALNSNVRRKIDIIDGKEDRLNFKSTSYLTYSRSGSYTNIDIKDDIKTLIDSISGKQDALTEAQLNNINNAITSISVNNVEQVNTNGTVNLTIPNATTEQDGMMSASDKTKLDSLENYTLPAATDTTLGGVNIGYLNGGVPSILHINNGSLTARVVLYYIKESKTLKLIDFINDSEITTIDCTELIKDGPTASITENGLMSKEDKAKLDSQPTIKANNATGVTDDDYVVIKKSEYQSILDRLSALENKA